MTDRLTYDNTDDKTLPAVCYALYLLSFATGISVLVGAIIAYMNRDKGGPVARSHYEFLTRTFWMGIAWAILAGLMCAAGAILSIVLIGIPILMLGAFIFAVLGIWFAVRCIIGVIYLARGEAYPRPYTWLA